jgi:membrane protein DedA with SNARE-associated domain
MFSNGLVSFPSSQIIYLGLGYYLSEKPYFEILSYVIIGSIGNTLGNLALFYILKYKNSFLETKILSFLKYDPEKISFYRAKAEKRLFLWVFTGKLIPSVKVFIPILASVLHMKPLSAMLAFFLGSFVWASGLIFVGYFFGKNINLGLFFLIMLAIYAFVFWIYKPKVKRQ